MRQVILRAAIVIVAAAGLAWGAHAQDDGIDVPDHGERTHERVDGAVGNFTDSIPIAVPPYHGLEPSLALTYWENWGQMKK